MENIGSPAPKKRRLFLALKKTLKDSNNSTCFSSPTKTDKFEKVPEGVVPANTRNSTNRAVWTFLLWVDEHNLHNR